MLYDANTLNACFIAQLQYNVELVNSLSLLYANVCLPTLEL